MGGRNLFFNGLDGAEGGYFRSPLAPIDFLTRLRHRHPAPAPVPTGVLLDAQPDRLAETGWGILWPGEVRPEIEGALAPLLEHRRRQVEAAGAGKYWSLNYRGEEGEKFLESHGASILGPVDPKRFPYYLLIIGGPDQIPFEFQYRLSESHLVGRLCFDELDGYANYARNVVSVESAEVQPSRQLTIFGALNSDDPPTQASVTHLAEPLVDHLGDMDGWQIGAVMNEAATKERLVKLLGGEETPAVLFTAGHAVCYRSNSAKLRTHQGGLVCSDWPGPSQWPGPSPPEHFLVAEDVPQQADLRGLISFHFACYSAGTPSLDSFPEARDGRFPEGRFLTERPFVASLPKRLLGHPRGSLAFVGHVDRAWQHSFVWRDVRGQVEAFESFMRGLMKGLPVGLALSAFAERNAAIGQEITRAWIRGKQGEALDEIEQARLWISHHDARSYILLGDPAARLPTESSSRGR